MRAAGTLAAYLHSEIMRVVPTYVGLGCVVLLWALWIGRTKFPVIASEEDASGEKGRFTELFRFPHLWLAVLAQFCYVRCAGEYVECVHLLHAAVHGRRASERLHCV